MSQSLCFRVCAARINQDSAMTYIIPITDFWRKQRVFIVPILILSQFLCCQSEQKKVKKNEEKITIHIQLIKAKNGKNIWMGKFEGELEDIFRIRETICEKIHEILITDNELRRTVQINPDSNNSYFKIMQKDNHDNPVNIKYVSNGLHFLSTPKTFKDII